MFTVICVCRCRVITLSNGLRALLISDQQSEAQRSDGLDPNLSQNVEHPVNTETDKSSCLQKTSAEYDDTVDDSGIIESDDGDSNWTDESSDGDMSSSSMQDSGSDSAGSSKKVSGKKRSQHSRSASNVHHVCNGEKLVRVVYSGFVVSFITDWNVLTYNAYSF